jgi:hypothetical protein
MPQQHEFELGLVRRAQHLQCENLLSELVCK